MVRLKMGEGNGISYEFSSNIPSQYPAFRARQVLNSLSKDQLIEYILTFNEHNISSEGDEDIYISPEGLNIIKYSVLLMKRGEQEIYDRLKAWAKIRYKFINSLKKLPKHIGWKIV